MYEDIPEDDQFKLLPNIHKTDLRFEIWGAAKDIGYIHKELQNLALNHSVPSDTRVEFDTARNIFLYSHYSYRLTNVAAQVALGVLEKFLKSELTERRKLVLSKDTLGPLIEYSIENELVTSEFFNRSSLARYEHLVRMDKQSLKKYFKVLVSKRRNSLTHDSHKAEIPWNNLDTLRIVSGVINFLTEDSAYVRAKI